MKESFILYTEQAEIINELTDEEAGQLLKAIYKYANGEEIELTGMTKLAFIPIRQQIDRNAEKYEAFKEKQAENGKKGGRPKREENPKNPTLLEENPKNPTVFSKTQKSLNVNVNVNDNVNVNVNDNNTPPISPQGDKADVINLSSDFVTFGEYQNVYLTPLMRNEIDTYVMDKKAASDLIEDLSLNIIRNKAPIFDARNPKMHLAELKAYWNYRRKHNNKPTETEQDEAIAIFCGKRTVTNG